MISKLNSLAQLSLNPFGEMEYDPSNFLFSLPQSVRKDIYDQVYERITPPKLDYLLTEKWKALPDHIEGTGRYNQFRR